VANCFCGCRRKITFRTRGFNKQGKRTVDLLAELEHLRNVVVADGSWAQEMDPDRFEALRAQVEEAITEGQEYRRFWQGCVHHDEIPSVAEARRIKGKWNAWGRGGRYAVKAFAPMDPRAP
jgi:hypothetical protein